MKEILTLILLLSTSVAYSQTDTLTAKERTRQKIEKIPDTGSARKGVEGLREALSTIAENYVPNGAEKTEAKYTFSTSKEKTLISIVVDPVNGQDSLRNDQYSIVDKYYKHSIRDQFTVRFRTLGAALQFCSASSHDYFTIGLENSSSTRPVSIGRYATIRHKYITILGRTSEDETPSYINVDQYIDIGDGGALVIRQSTMSFSKNNAISVVGGHLDIASSTINLGTNNNIIGGVRGLINIDGNVFNFQTNNQSIVEPFGGYALILAFGSHGQNTWNHGGFSGLRLFVPDKEGYNTRLSAAKDTKFPAW